MELVDAIELRLGEGGQMVFCELFDRGDEVGLKVCHGRDSCPCVVVVNNRRRPARLYRRFVQFSWGRFGDAERARR